MSKKKASKKTAPKKEDVQGAVPEKLTAHNIPMRAIKYDQEKQVTRAKFLTHGDPVEVELAGNQTHRKGKMRLAHRAMLVLEERGKK